MRPALPSILAVAFATVLVLPLAGAQEHEHGGDAGMAMVLYDGPASGRAVVGAYTHFGFALLDKDGVPVVHQNAEFNVLQGSDVLLSTTDAHEYDGLFSLDLRFTRPGPYQVIATSGEMELGLFEGEVIEPVNASEATVEFTQAPGMPGSRVASFELRILDASGALFEHTDAIVEFRDASSGALAARTHLHIHDAPIQFQQGLGPATEYVANVVAYKAFATGRSPDMQAVVAEFPVTVGAIAPPDVATPDLGVPELLAPLGARAEADGYQLFATYDPNNQVGLGQPARISGILVDAQERMPVAHVDYVLALSGPRGTVFQSATLHEYDGHLEYLFVPDAPGVYDGAITAIYNETELTVPVRLVVVPPVVAIGGSVGPATLAVDGLDAVVAGEAANLTFRAMGPNGPAAHSEVDVTVFHHDEPPLYQFKLHTHDSGLTNAVLTFPHDGEWMVRIDGLPTAPDPAVFPPTLLTFTVAPGDPGAEAAGAITGAAEQTVPGPALVYLTLALLGVALLRRR